MATRCIPLAGYRRAGRIILLTLFALALSSVSSAQARTVVSLTFDDGIETQYQNAAPMLAAHGMHGTFYMNSETVASKPYFMTWDQIEALGAQGNEIGGHTLNHVRLPDLTDAEQRRQICDDASNLRSHGFTVTSFAYPYGAGSTSPTVLSSLQDCGYASARKVGLLNSDPGCGSTCPYAENLPPADPYKVRATPYLDRPITLSDLEGWVMDAESHGGGWLPFMFHDICDNCGPSSVSVSDFATFLDWLQARAANNTVVMTMRDALVSAPKPHPTTTISCDGHACSSAWQKGPVTVALSAADGGGGLGATRYTLDGSDPTPSSPEFTAPFTLAGSATVKFRTWDLGGNPETVRSQQLKIDATGPTAAISSPADGASVFGDVIVKVDASDAGSGVQDVQLFVDGDYRDYSRSKTSPYLFTLANGTLSLGAHRLKALVADTLGNTSWTAPVTLTLKDGRPTTSIACDGATCPAGFVKGPVQVSLAATDGGGGLGATRYTLDGSDPSPSSIQYAGPFTLTDTTTVKYRSYDSYGNAENVRSQTIKIDAVAPAAAISSPADGANLVPGDVTVKVDATDAGSGVSDVELFVDGDYRDYSRSKTSPYLFTLANGTLSLGTHRLKALVADALGNHAWAAPVTVTLKDGLPTTSIACDGSACPTGFVKGPVSVSLSASDGGGGLGATRYTLDGSDPSPSSTQYSGPFTLTDSAIVKFRTWDLGGNPEAVRSEQLKIDATGPTAAISSPADGTTVVGDVSVNVDGSDAGSGISDVELFADGDYVDYSRSKSSPYGFTLPAGRLAVGTHRLKALVTDALGNRTWTAPVTVTLKDGLPTTTIACDGSACPTGFVKGPVSVSLSASDGGGGLAATRYTLDGSDPTPSSTQYTGTFTLTDTTTVKYRSYDSNGNAEPVRSQTIKLDSTAPTAAIRAPADGASLLPGDIAVKVDATDAGSGVAGVEIYVDGDYRDFSKSRASPYEFTLAAGTLSLGNHKLKALVSDALGNRSWTAPVTLTIVDGLPTTTIACDGSACPTGFVKGPVQVTLAAIDGGNGVSSTHFTTDGSDPSAGSPAYTGPFTLTDTTTVKFRSFDSNGNAESVRSQTIKLDSTAPTAQIAAPLEGATVSGDVTVRISAVDAGSGISDVQLFVDGDYVDFSRSKSAPYEITWHTGLFTPGAHHLKAIVMDALGNRASTPYVTVNVAG